MVDFPYKDHYGWDDLLAITRLLRSPQGCPWDQKQTHLSIRRNFLEETYEVLDALDRDDAKNLCEELGDVLLQVAFHAIMEEERGRFTADDVADGVCKKLLYRHPHVFGSAEAKDGEQALANWEARKIEEHGYRSVSDAVEAVPHTLPALWRAEKIVKKTVRAGFNWDSADGALNKLDEECRELREALSRDDPVDAPHGVKEELGDALFILAKLAQMHGVDPEEALHDACDKFSARFRKAEAAADKPFSEYSEAERVRLWEDAKKG